MSFLRRTITLPGRGAGSLAGLDFGNPDSPIGLVFLHANGFNARTYRSLLDPLAAGRRILAIDQRGHGLTTLPTDPDARRDWYDLRDDLLALLGALDLEDVVLAGHSMGGAVSLLSAACAPERVRSLVLLDPVIVSPERARRLRGETSPLLTAARRRRALYPSRAAVRDAYLGRGAFSTWPIDVLADYVEDGFLDLPNGEVTLACTPAWEASGFQSQEHETWDAFERSVCPIRILRAEFDSTCGVEGRVDALTASGRITVETIAGTTHFLPMERPEVCRAALARALDEPTTPARG